jgi:hypothetical protein
MNVVDSSAWLEYIAEGPLAAEFASVIEDGPKLVVLSITSSSWAQSSQSQ